MPFCLNCKREYPDGHAVCADCGAPLLEELPTAPPDPPAFLCSLEDGIKSDIAVSLLESNNIPVIRKRRKAGEYLKIYMGMSCYGIDIYVPAKLIAQAKEILSAQPIIDKEDIPDEESGNPFRKKEKHQETHYSWSHYCFCVSRNHMVHYRPCFEIHLKTSMSIICRKRNR